MLSLWNHEVQTENVLHSSKRVHLSFWKSQRNYCFTFPSYLLHSWNLACIHSLIQGEPSTSHVPGTWLASGDTGRNETCPKSCGAHILMEKEVHIDYHPIA